MAATDFSQFHELAEQFKGEIPLAQMCEQEGVPYRSYLAWRSKMGIAPRRKRKCSTPVGMIEMEAVGAPEIQTACRVTSIHIEFENGLKFDRQDMDMDTLVEFLSKIRGALCLG